MRCNTGKGCLSGIVGRKCHNRTCFCDGIGGVATLLFNKRALSLRSVSVAAILVMLLHPSALLGPGFQMPFAVTLAVINVIKSVRKSAGNPSLNGPNRFEWSKCIRWWPDWQPHRLRRRISIWLASQLHLSATDRLSYYVSWSHRNDVAADRT